MKGKNRDSWIDVGYQSVAQKGFRSINIESLSRALKKNKSSFYHYFGSLKSYEAELLNHHLLEAKAFAKKANECSNIIPEMINLFIDHQTDIFFHKQLRINRQNPKYKACFTFVFQQFEEAILEEWIGFLNLQHQPLLARRILHLISENFLLQITPEHYNYHWLEDYLKDMVKLMHDLKPRE